MSARVCGKRLLGQAGHSLHIGRHYHRLFEVAGDHRTGQGVAPARGALANDYIHELSMFPNGKYADQVDSTSQALKFIGERDPSAGFLEYVRAEVLSRHGISSKDLTVCFDHPDPKGRFTLSNGREIWRQGDGYYWVTEGEWSNGANSIFCVTRLD